LFRRNLALRLNPGGRAGIAFDFIVEQSSTWTRDRWGAATGRLLTRAALIVVAVQLEALL
jgi:hypothetical protein